ncbi:unnamed protein product [Adineta steineri]|uniref:Tudor domain-containing protein n=1 Tax=Adineta steineri TaxID=433720 RepID=A0A815A7Q5_9BILA|nr:unnamed protein product [Adineta steineri]
MALNTVVIVEFGAQKQRVSLDINSSYKDICEQIYSLFKLDFTKSKYILQRQDPFKSGLFVNIDERTFINDLKYNPANNNKNSVTRLRLVPINSQNSSKPINGHVNGEKAWSTSSQCLQDESDRTSVTSATTIDIKQLIKKCLTNLKETTENIQLLDRCLHPEDYIDNESPSTNKSLSNNDINRQISQVLSTSNSHIPTSDIVDELVPALNHLMNIQQPLSLSRNKSIESPSVLPQPIVNNQIQTPTPTANVPSRSTNKSFSNRLGTTVPSNQSQNSSVQESRPISTSQKPKSPVTVKQSTILSKNKIQNEPISKETLPTTTSKCKIQLKQYESGTTIEGIVSVASNASYFFLQLIDQQKDEFDYLSKNLHEYFSNLDKNSHYRPSPGDFCVAMYTEDARWYRARIIRYISDQICEVFYIDYGNMEELPIDLVHEISSDFTRLPARAIACTIAEILPPIGQDGWTKRATFAFASRCSNERVQATVIASTNLKWPMHIVQLRVSKSQEDIGAALESCKVARRVSNNDICEFWSNKIRIEQYILYNLQEPNSNRFPSIEQAQVKNEKEDIANTFLSSSLQQSPFTTDGSTREKTPIIEETNVLKEITNEEQNENEQNKQSPLDIAAMEKKEEQEEEEEEKNEKETKTSTPVTPSSALNPDATPFITVSRNGNENIQSVSTGDESDDEKDSNDTPITSDSAERPRMPIKEEVIVDTSLMPSAPLIKSWLPIEVTHIETPTRFYIRYIYGPSWNLGNGETPELLDQKELPDKNVILKELTQEMTQCYNKQKRICPGTSYDEGELVAVKSRLQWHRGRFIQYKPNIDFAHIFFVDYGYTRSVPIQMIRPINNRFVVHPEQAHLVHLHQPGQRRGRIEWNRNVIEEFEEMTKDGTYLYARIINEPNTIDLMSYDPLTKKWFSFYEHFVKHLNDNDKIEEKTE